MNDAAKLPPALPDVSTWVLVSVGNGRRFFGAPQTPDESGALTLSPVYEVMVALDPQGQYQRRVIPLECMASATRLALQPITMMPLSWLSAPDRATWSKLALAAEALRAQLVQVDGPGRIIHAAGRM